jgi:hypothetical protein
MLLNMLVRVPPYINFPVKLLSIIGYCRYHIVHISPPFACIFACVDFGMSDGVFLGHKIVTNTSRLVIEELIWCDRLSYVVSELLKR